MPTAPLNGHAMYYELHGPVDAPRALVMGGWGTWCHGDAGGLPRGLTDRYRVVIFDHRGIGKYLYRDSFSTGGLTKQKALCGRAFLHR